ncbi:MAG TPA: hypothetical protein VJL29_12160 [Thermoguttaceae bacterium]|nr:hypothetical protein [Thermoguttaceae bacterium]
MRQSVRRSCNLRSVKHLRHVRPSFLRRAVGDEEPFATDTCAATAIGAGPAMPSRYNRSKFRYPTIVKTRKDIQPFLGIRLGIHLGKGTAFDSVGIAS